MYPELENEKFIVTEKIDGCNVQIAASPDGELKIGKRTSWLEPEDKFYDVLDNLHKNHAELLEAIKGYAKDIQKEVRFYGEYYGRGMQNRIDYGDDRCLSIFDVSIDGKIVPYSSMPFTTFTLNRGSLRITARYFEKHLTDVYSKIFKIGYPTGSNLSLRSLLDYDIEKYKNIEGVIIRPYNKDYYLPNGDRFILKKKHKDFADKEHKKRVKAAKEQHPLNALFTTYINENRALDLFSKHGQISSKAQIAEYIKLLLADATDDFSKDHPQVLGLEKKEQKTIYNVGSVAANLLLNHL